MNEHERIDNLLTEYLLGQLSGQDAADVQSHLSQCSQCRDEAQSLRALLDGTERFRGLSADEQLCESAKQRVLAAVSNQSTESENPRAETGPMLKWRVIMKSPFAKLAAAAVMVLVAGIAIQSMLPTAPVFADVAGPILKAHTAVYTMVIKVKDQPAQTALGMYMAPGLLRQEMNILGVEQIQIWDMHNSKMLMLMPDQKMAMVTEIENYPIMPEATQYGMFEQLRERIREAQENPDESVEELGRSNVAGREAIGFRIGQQGMGSITIWADAETFLPLQVEVLMPPIMGQQGSVLMMDIDVDVDLDPALFSTDVPEGYMQHTMQVDGSLPGEQDLIEALRVWGETTDGKFPPELTIKASKELMHTVERTEGMKVDKEKGLADPALQEFLQLFNKVNRGYMFAQMLPEDADWHYEGKDAAYGDPDAAIFWYKPEGSDNYRVIFADLTVAEVAPDQLPQ